MRIGLPRIYLILLLLCCFPLPFCLAQEGRCNFINLTEKDGFNANIITCMLLDRKGYIWFGTRQGLNRYDGYKIERFTAGYGLSNGISGNYICGLAEDKSGHLWIGTEKNGLNSYDPVKKRFTHFMHKDGDTNSVVTDALTKLFIEPQQALDRVSWRGLVDL
jgi:ligand-binding sensor domain-containing protein